MNVVLSFAPLIIFPIVSGFYTVNTGLWAALLAALIVLTVDRLSAHGSVKILNLGTVALFAILAVVGALLHSEWNGLWVRLVIDTGLLAIVSFTIAIRRPFT